MNPFKAYMVLNCHPANTDEEIKAAHRRLSQQYHPDREGGDQDRFMMVQAAFKLVKDAPARSLLKTRLKGLGSPCTPCRERGFTRRGGGFVKGPATVCSACGGAGYIERMKK